MNQNSNQGPTLDLDSSDEFGTKADTYNTRIKSKLVAEEEASQDKKSEFDVDKKMDTAVRKFIKSKDFKKVHQQQQHDQKKTKVKPKGVAVPKLQEQKKGSNVHIYIIALLALLVGILFIVKKM